MNPKTVKKALKDAIQAMTDYKWLFSDLQIAANPKDPDSYYPGVNGQRAYNLLHINAMYDLHQHIYVDALVQKSRKADESAALTAMVDRSAIESALLLADRGYES